MIYCNPYQLNKQ